MIQPESKWSFPCILLQCVADIMGIINDSTDYTVPPIWNETAHALSEHTNIYLCRTVLCMVADLMYLTCLDGAPLLVQNATKMHARLEHIVVPFLKEKRPAMANTVTWDYCLRAGMCLSQAFQLVFLLLISTEFQC